MSEQSSPPHSTVQKAIIRISSRSCRVLSPRGSSSSAKQAANSPMDPPPNQSPYVEPTLDHAASPCSTSKKSNAIPLGRNGREWVAGVVLGIQEELETVK